MAFDASQKPGLQAREVTSRRTALKLLGAGAVGLGLGAPMTGRVLAQEQTGPDARRGATAALRPFDLSDVRLLDGPFRDAQQGDGAYMLSLDPDRLLHNFRINAGLPARAPVYGGWESQEPWVDIRCHGHTLGHWLTAGSLMYAATGDERFTSRVGYIVDELKACQDSGGTGLVCAFPDNDETLLAAVAGRGYPGVPWYTMHKIFAGLRDAHVLAGNAGALEILIRMTDWARDLTSPMSDVGFQRMLDREHGGMSELLADVYALTGVEDNLSLALRFCHQALLQPLARGEDPLDGLHGNTQIPKVVGFVRLYQLTGDPVYMAAAAFFWDRVANHRSFVTGGHGDVEHFFPPTGFPAHLDSAKTNETCGSYNMLRLTRMLYTHDPSTRYADFYERALYNTILASQDPGSGWNTYFQATRPGYLKLYHTPEDSFWCCTGTGMENHAKYGDSIYFHGPDTLYVNLFIPSEVTWAEKGVTLRQTTRFPDDDRVQLAVEASRPVRATLQLRRPSWSQEASVSVNGESLEANAAPGSYIPIERDWRSGDRIELRLPMRVRGVELPGDPNRIAFVYGPVVLAGRLGTGGLYPGADILRNERTSGQILDAPIEVPELAGPSESAASRVHRVDDGDSLAFETEGIGREGNVTLIPYHRLHHERYNLYWRVRNA